MKHFFEPFTQIQEDNHIANTKRFPKALLHTMHEWEKSQSFFKQESKRNDTDEKHKKQESHA